MSAVYNRVHEVEVSHDHHGSGRFGLGLECSAVEWSGVECGGEIAGTNVGLSVCLAVS